MTYPLALGSFCKPESILEIAVIRRTYPFGVARPISSPQDCPVQCLIARSNDLFLKFFMENKNKLNYLQKQDVKQALSPRPRVLIAQKTLNNSIFKSVSLHFKMFWNCQLFIYISKRFGIVSCLFTF